MATSRDVWVLLEEATKTLDATALSLLNEGRLLGHELGGDLCVVLLAAGGPSLTSELQAQGVVRLYHLPEGSQKSSHLEAAVAMLDGILRAQAPALMLTHSSAWGAELMPRLAVRAGVPLVTNCLEVRAAPNIEFVKAVHDGAAQATVNCEADTTCLATLDSTARNLGGNVEPAASIELVALEGAPNVAPTQAHRTAFLAADPATADIAEAEFVVAIGRGVAVDGNIAVFERFAEAIGATIAGSLPVIDQGVLPQNRQVGQTGKTIAPRLALLCGISGSEYFLKGIQKATTLIAINNDRQAPVFSHVELGVVADANVLLARLTAHLSTQSKKAPLP